MKNKQVRGYIMKDNKELCGFECQFATLGSICKAVGPCNMVAKNGIYYIVIR